MKYNWIGVLHLSHLCSAAIAYVDERSSSPSCGRETWRDSDRRRTNEYYVSPTVKPSSDLLTPYFRVARHLRCSIIPELLNENSVVLRSRRDFCSSSSKVHIPYCFLFWKYRQLGIRLPANRLRVWLSKDRENLDMYARNRRMEKLNCNFINCRSVCVEI